jgi:chromosomal replication initiator protein
MMMREIEPNESIVDLPPPDLCFQPGPSIPAMARDTDLDKIWERVLYKLSKKLKKPSFETWIKPCKLVSIEDSHVVIAVRNEFSRNFIIQSFSRQMHEAIKESLAAKLGLRIIVDAAIEELPSGTAQASLAELSVPELSHKHEAQFDRIQEQFQFKNLLQADFNQVAANFVRALINPRQSTYKSLYLHSQAGLGKTHLLLAAINELSRINPAFKIKYIKAEEFTNELVKAIRTNNTQEFRSKFRGLDLLALDDIHFFEGKKASQEEFFYTYEAILQRGGKLIVSSLKAAPELNKIESNLKNRFCGFLTATIDAPDFEARFKILKHKKQEMNLHIDDDYLALIARKYQNDIRELEGAILQISAHQEFCKHSIDKELINKLFGSIVHSSNFQGLNLDKITAQVAEYFGLSSQELRSKKRHQDIAKARHIAIYLAYDLLNISYARIGEYFSGRKHSSIIHSIDYVKKRSLSIAVDDIKAKLLA